MTAMCAKLIPPRHHLQVLINTTSYHGGEILFDVFLADRHFCGYATFMHGRGHERVILSRKQKPIGPSSFAPRSVERGRGVSRQSPGSLKKKKKKKKKKKTKKKNKKKKK